MKQFSQKRKVDITQAFIEEGKSHLALDVALKLWWVSLDHPGLRLSKEGHTYCKKVLKLTQYAVEVPGFIPSSVFLDLARLMTEPYYISNHQTNAKVYVFSEADATMLYLMNGNLKQFLNTKQ